MITRNIIRYLTSSKEVYNFEELGKNPMSGSYSGKIGYLDYLKTIENFSDPKKIDSVSQNFKKLYNSKQEISNLGIGSYLGSPTVDDDRRLNDAIINSIKSGINVIDTAANYRYYKSERTIGWALKSLMEVSKFSRENVFLCSKIGYLTEDPDRKMTSVEIIKKLIENTSKNQKLTPISTDDFIGEAHSIHPSYLAYQLDETLNNLNVSTLDVLYLHNVFEMQLTFKGKSKTFEDLKKAFQFCEQSIADGKVVYYGLATWNTFRSKSQEVGIHIPIEEVVDLAKEVGGTTHGFRFIQMPLNFIMHEPYSMNWQRLSSKNTNLSSLEVAHELGINIITSASLMQKYALRIEFPYTELGLSSNAQAHLQLIRSMPFEGIKSSLVGMLTPQNVEENSKLSSIKMLDKNEFNNFIKPLRPK